MIRTKLKRTHEQTDGQFDKYTQTIEGKKRDYLKFSMIEITVLDPTACRLGFDVANVDFTWMAYVVIVPVMMNN